MYMVLVVVIVDHINLVVLWYSKFGGLICLALDTEVHDIDFTMYSFNRF